VTDLKLVIKWTTTYHIVNIIKSDICILHSKAYAQIIWHTVLDFSNMDRVKTTIILTDKTYVSLVKKNWLLFLSFLKMTTQEVRLCGLLLQEHFGDVVEKVGTHLNRSGVLNLRALAHETKLGLDLVMACSWVSLLSSHTILHHLVHILSVFIFPL